MEFLLDWVTKFSPSDLVLGAIIAVGFWKLDRSISKVTAFSGAMATILVRLLEERGDDMAADMLEELKKWVK